MATDSFKFWDSYYEACEDYTDEEFGMLIRALARAVFAGEMPEFGENKYLKSTFKVMFAQADESRRIAEMKRECGRKGGRPRKKNTGEKPPENQCFNEKKRREENRNESSLLSSSLYFGPAAGADAPPPPIQ